MASLGYNLRYGTPNCLNKIYQCVYFKSVQYVIISYNTLRRAMTEYMHDSRGCAAPKGECVYFSHSPTNHAITVMFYTSSR